MSLPDSHPSDAEGEGSSEFAKAREDFRHRTLDYVEGDLTQLVYLASSRDYNSGTYRHDGMAAHFSEQTAHRVLEESHRDVFARIVRMPLAVLVEELRLYVEANGPDSLQVWRELKPYQIAVPFGVPTVTASLFISNLKVALEILSSTR